MYARKVLVCDDEPHIVHVLCAKLRNAGLEVLTAHDGQEAFDLACRECPHLVFTDYQMPQLSGLELCAKLRADPRTRHIPAVMLTARGYYLSERELADTNILKVLPKPFSPREVLSIAEEILRRHPTPTAAVGEGSLL